MPVIQDGKYQQIQWEENTTPYLCSFSYSKPVSKPLLSISKIDLVIQGSVMVLVY